MSDLIKLYYGVFRQPVSVNSDVLKHTKCNICNKTVYSIINSKYYCKECFKKAIKVLKQVRNLEDDDSRYISDTPKNDNPYVYDEVIE